MMKLLPCILALVASFPAPAQKHMAATDAQTGGNTTGYTSANTAGCQVWVPLQLHAPDYVPRYTGACKDGKANGKGSLQWLYAYAEMKPKTTWQGFFQDGVYVGDNALSHSIEPQPRSNDYWVRMGTIGAGDVVLVAQNDNDGRLDLCAPSLVALSLNSRTSPTDDIAVKQAIKDAATRVQVACAQPKHNGTQVNVYTEAYRLGANNRRPQPVADANMNWSDGSVSGYSNRAANEAKGREMTNTRNTKAAASRARFDEFTRRNGITYWVTVAQLDKNPFKYEGKTVGLIVQLDRMLTANTAIIEGGMEDDGGSAQLHGITPDFPSDNKSVLLAARVGRREAPADNSSGSLTYTSLNRVAQETCTRSGCYDWLEWTGRDSSIDWGQPYAPGR